MDDEGERSKGKSVGKRMLGCTVGQLLPENFAEEWSCLWALPQGLPAASTSCALQQFSKQNLLSILEM